MFHRPFEPKVALVPMIEAIQEPERPASRQCALDLPEPCRIRARRRFQAQPRSTAAAFTLVELLVVIAIVGLLAGMILPALAGAGHRARQTQCSGNFRQIGVGFALYLSDHAEVFPDRRDLKSSLGYKPWSDWPLSDPRGGWAARVLGSILPAKSWQCAGRISPLWNKIPAAGQFSTTDDPSSAVHYWLWRFDRTNDSIPPDNFWGKSAEAAVKEYAASRAASGETISGEAEVELVVDAYFPMTNTNLPPEIRGLTPHPGGRNRLFLDGHTAFQKDARLRSR